MPKLFGKQASKKKTRGAVGYIQGVYDSFVDHDVTSLEQFDAKSSSKKRKMFQYKKFNKTNKQATDIASYLRHNTFNYRTVIIIALETGKVLHELVKLSSFATAQNNREEMEKAVTNLYVSKGLEVPQNLHFTGCMQDQEERVQESVEEEKEEDDDEDEEDEEEEEKVEDEAKEEESEDEEEEKNDDSETEAEEGDEPATSEQDDFGHSNAEVESNNEDTVVIKCDFPNVTLRRPRRPLPITDEVSVDAVEAVGSVAEATGKDLELDGSAEDEAGGDDDVTLVANLEDKMGVLDLKEEVTLTEGMEPAREQRHENTKAPQPGAVYKTSKVRAKRTQRWEQPIRVGAFEEVAPDPNLSNVEEWGAKDLTQADDSFFVGEGCKKKVPLRNESFLDDTGSFNSFSKWIPPQTSTPTKSTLPQNQEQKRRAKRGFIKRFPEEDDRIQDALVLMKSEAKNIKKKSEKSPRQLTIDLLPHQKKALSWLMWKEKVHPKGGILGDDAGLGKTLTMLALILRQKELNEENSRGTLVLVPEAIIKCWQAEIWKQLKPGSLNVCVYRGDVEPLSKHEVVISSYEVLLHEKDSEKGILFKQKWQRLILDEAHLLCDVNSQLHACVKLLSSRHKWCLSGKELSNKELFCLFSVLNFTPFNDSRVWQVMCHVTFLKKYKRVLQSILLKRRKLDLFSDNILDLYLAKHGVHELVIEMPTNERCIYQDILFKTKRLFAKMCIEQAENLELNKREVQEKLHREGFIITEDEIDKEEYVNVDQIVALLLRLQQACSHMSLVEEELDPSILESHHLNPRVCEVELVKELECFSLIEPDHSNFNSAKMQIILELVNKVEKKDQRLAIFSQWKGFLELLKSHLTFSSIVTTENSTQEISDFNSCFGSMVLLVCTRKVESYLGLLKNCHILLTDWDLSPCKTIGILLHRFGLKNRSCIFKVLTRNTIESSLGHLQDENVRFSEQGFDMDDLRLILKRA